MHIGHDSAMTIGGKKHFIQTEYLSTGRPMIITKVFVDGTVTDTIKAPLPKNATLSENDIKEKIQVQHEAMRSKLNPESADTTRSKAEYMRKIRWFIDRGRFDEAYTLNNEALLFNKNNPFFQSFYGYLDAAAMKNHQAGLETCKRALEKYHGDSRIKKNKGESFLHLNIGRVYLLMDNREFAVVNFRKGLKVDNRNRDIITELAKLGIRRPPPFRFLPREHFLNKYIGLLMTRIGLR